MRLVDPEPDRTEYAGEVGDVHRLFHRLPDEPVIDHVLERKEPADVGLRLFNRRTQFLHRVAGRRLFPVERDRVGPEPVHELMCESVREEWVEGDGGLLRGIERDPRDRLEYRHEFGFLDVFQHHPLAPLLGGHALVVREVECRRLHAFTRLPSRHHFIHYADGGERAQLRISVARLDREGVLDLLQVRREECELRG